MANWILSQNEECHDVSTSPELALVAGFSFSHVLAAAAGKTVVCVDEAPESCAANTVKPAKAADLEFSAEYEFVEGCPWTFFAR